MARFARCIVHIGTEKTGTTSIQHWLSLNRARLKTLGVLVPTSPGKLAHERLSAYAQNDEKYDDTRARALASAGCDLAAFRALMEKELLAEANAAPPAVDTLLLSCEHLHSRLTTPEEKERLRALLVRLADRIEILVYLRRQDQLSLSAFSTWVKTGARKYDAPMPLGGKKLPYYYDFHRMLSEYADIFGRDCITVRVYEPERLKDGDVVVDFRDAAGIPDSADYDEVRRNNPSLPAGGQRLLATINAMLHDAGVMHVGGAPLHHGLRDIIVDIADSLEDGVARTVPRKRAKAFFNRFKAGNEAVRAEYFPDTPTLFSKGMMMYPERVRQTPVLSEALQIAAQTIIRQQEIIQSLREPPKVPDKKS